MRSERSVKSNFLLNAFIMCIFLIGVKYQQRHTIYIEKNNLSRILTIILVSFNENESKLQKMADRANSTFNEEQLLFITRKLCNGEKVSATRLSYRTEYHCNTPHKVPCKTAFFRVANRLKTCGNSHSKHLSGRPGYIFR